MKTNETNRIKLVSMVLACFSIYLIAQSPAKADSPRSWGYWNAGPAAGVKSTGSGGFETTSSGLTKIQNNNNGSQLNDEQNVSRLDRGLSGDTANNKANLRGDYVAYNICYFNCTGNGLKSVPTTAGKLDIDVNTGEFIKTDSFSSRFVTKSTSYYEAELVSVGQYNGIASNSIDTGFLVESSDTYFFGLVIEKANFSSKGHNQQYISPGLAYSANGENGYISSRGNISGTTMGEYYIGKPITASQIATQLSLGNTYHFNGFSHLGSNVKVAINFKNANWNAAWSANSYHNGFNANGNLKQSTLISNQLKGIGDAGVGFVTDGKVNATLVGVITGGDTSKTAVIGNAVVSVQQSKGTKTVGDIFTATTTHP